MGLDHLSIGNIAVQHLPLPLHIHLVHGHHHVNVLRLGAGQVKEPAERAGRVHAGCLNAISGTAVAKSIDKHTPSVAAAASDAAPRGNIY